LFDAECCGVKTSLAAFLQCEISSQMITHPRVYVIPYLLHLLRNLTRLSLSLSLFVSQNLPKATAYPARLSSGSNGANSATKAKAPKAGGKGHDKARIRWNFEQEEM
jgi:hypothetical protein